MSSSQKTLGKTIVVNTLIQLCLCQKYFMFKLKMLISKICETLVSLSVWILVEITKTRSISVKNLLYCREIVQMSSLMSVKWGLFVTSVFPWARNLELVACVILPPCHRTGRVAWENGVKVVQMSLNLRYSPRAKRVWENQRFLYYYKVRFTLCIRLIYT